MENSVKIMTLASFVNEDKVESFVKYLNKRFNLSPEKIFIYTYRELFMTRYTVVFIYICVQ